MITLNSYEHENLYDCLTAIQNDFDIDLEQSELEQISNFDELIDLIISKIGLEHAENCTKQQAFYKLRNAIAEIRQLDPKTIHPQTELTDLFDPKTIRSETETIEEKLGFKVAIIGPSTFVIVTLVVFFAGSLTLFFYDYKLAFLSLALCFIYYKSARIFSKEIQFRTMRELTEHVVSYNYIKVRRDPETVNKNELNEILRSLFSEDLGIAANKLHEIHFK